MAPPLVRCPALLHLHPSSLNLNLSDAAVNKPLQNPLCVFFKPCSLFVKCLCPFQPRTDSPSTRRQQLASPPRVGRLSHSSLITLEQFLQWVRSSCCGWGGISLRQFTVTMPLSLSRRAVILLLNSNDLWERLVRSQCFSCGLQGQCPCFCCQMSWCVYPGTRAALAYTAFMTKVYVARHPGTTRFDLSVRGA